MPVIIRVIQRDDVSLLSLLLLIRRLDFMLDTACTTNFIIPTVGRCKLDPSLKATRFQILIVKMITALSI